MKISASYITLWICLVAISCDNDDPFPNPALPTSAPNPAEQIDLPERDAPRPVTTDRVPHVQIDVEPVEEINDELVRRVYSVPNIEDHPSVVGGWRGIWLSEQVKVFETQALIGDREFAHLHTDGSLHIFLDPDRADEAVEKGWGVHHPFAVDGQERWRGFIMLYTPQTVDELNVTFQLIIDAYNYITRSQLVATEYY